MATRINKALFALILLCAAAAVAAKPLPIEDYDGGEGIPVCYDFGCKVRADVVLPKKDWDGIASWFSPPAHTPLEEREQIQKAIGWMEVVIGRHTPTHKDVEFNLPKDPNHKDAFPGQMDCIDEAANTTTYLKLFAQTGLVRHHQIIAPAYRRSWYDQHWAAQIQEKVSGDEYVVDSWFQPNGYLPIIQDSKGWLKIKTWNSIALDNSPRRAKPPINHQAIASDIIAN